MNTDRPLTAIELERYVEFILAALRPLTTSQRDQVMAEVNRRLSSTEVF